MNLTKNEQLPIISTFSCEPVKILLTSISEQFSKLAVLFDDGNLRIIETQNLADAVILKKDLLAVGSLKITSPNNIEDIQWSLENSQESSFLSLLTAGGVVSIYTHKTGYEIMLYTVLNTAKLIDAFCWCKGDLSFCCCYQDGQISFQQIDLQNKTILTLFSMNLHLILNEVCLRISSPLPDLLVWEGNQNTAVLINRSKKCIKSVSSDFMNIHYALAGKFNTKTEDENLQNEEDQMEFFCEKNWAKSENKCATLIGVSQINGLIVCPNYFSTIEGSEELILIHSDDFDYKLTQDQILLLQSQGKVYRIHTKNHVNIIDWSPFVETHDYFVTYDVADQLIVWKCTKIKPEIINNLEINEVGLIIWIDSNKILVIQEQKKFTIIELNID